MQFIVQTASDALLYTDAALMKGMQNTLGFIDRGIKKAKRTDLLISTFYLLYFY